MVRVGKSYGKPISYIYIYIYYGAPGHGKGLVDAMSGFGVKGPLRKAVIT